MKAAYTYSEVYNCEGRCSEGAAPLIEVPDTVLVGGELFPGMAFADANYHLHDILTAEDCEFVQEVILYNINEGDDTSGIIDLDDFVVKWRNVSEEEMGKIINSWR